MTATTTTDVARTLDLLHPPGATFEVRILGIPGRGKPHTSAGYFRDGPAAVAAIERVEKRGPAGVYIVLNELNPALFARSPDRLTDFLEPTTSDGDITRRRWLLLDFDPKRPAGVSSTDQEHEAARHVALWCREWLTAESWPAPILADSGNGWHLLYRLDLAADEASTRLVQSILEAVAARVDELPDSGVVVEVDRKVFNPARISKVYGTMARKGHAIDDRPHRVSALVEVPEVVEVVPLDRLQAIAALAPRPEPQGRHEGNGAGGHRLDVAKWLNSRGVGFKVKDRPDRHGRTVYILSRCPFDEGHGGNGEVSVMQAPDGKLGAACMHASCTGQGWQQFKEKIGAPTGDQYDPPMGRPGNRNGQPATADELAAFGIEAADEGRTDGRGDPTQASEGPEPWGEPELFEEVTLPAFPLHLLPYPLGPWVEAEATATQTPPDLAAMLGLAVCSASVARRVEVEVKPGWLEPVNLYVVVVLESGNRKSAVFADATRPLRLQERDLADQAGPMVREATIALRALESRQKALETKAGKTNSDEERAELIHEAASVAADIAALPRPVLPKLIIDDCTAERLSGLLAEQGGRIASMAPEGSVFDLMKGAYSRNGCPMFGVYLLGHSGDDIRVDRVGRPAEYVFRPAITMALATQPDVVHGLFDVAEFRGRGLLARFLYSLPKSKLGRREIDPPPVPDDVANAYRGLIRCLCGLSPETDGKGREIPRRVGLDQAAGEELRGFLRRIEPDLAPGAAFDHFRDWAAKLGGAVVRLAGVLHLVVNANEFTPWSVPIGPATIRQAVGIGEYLTEHAGAAYAAMNVNREVGEAEYLWRWIVKHTTSPESGNCGIMSIVTGACEFSRRDLSRGVQSRYRRVELLDTPLLELCKRRLVRLKESPSPPRPGRPSSPIYQVNPVALAKSQTR